MRTSANSTPHNLETSTLTPTLSLLPTANPSLSADLRAARRYDLDWLRVIAILTLLFYHTGMIYVRWGWHIQSSETSPVFEDIMRWLHRWRMPLLFFISGAGTYFALNRRHKPNDPSSPFARYAWERTRRLFFPLVFGMFVIVPPQIYFEWLFRGRFTGTYAEFYPNVFDFIPYEDGGKGGAFSWHHLWFVSYLFLYSLLSIPVFRFMKSSAGSRFTNRVQSWISRPGGAMWLVLPIIVNDMTLGHFFPDETHALLNDWAYFVKNLLLFWLGYTLISRPAFWRILTDQRRWFLFGTLLCTVLMYSLLAMVRQHPELEDTLGWELPYSINSNCLMWFSVLMSVSYSYRYLNVNRPILPRLNEAVYPFYILHQTVIVAIGYYLQPTGLGVYSGFLIISLLSLATCIALYLLLIRPFKLTRFLLGMK